MGTLSKLMKTHHCGELNTSHIGGQVTLCGWVNKYRNLGGLHFIDLWDREGVVQLSFEQYTGDFEQLKNFSLESVLLARGEVRERPPEALNKKMKTGQIEIAVTHIELLSKAGIPPFLPRGAVTGGENLRLKYRYLDLRTQKLQDILRLRSQAAHTVRQLLYEHNFTEVETPVLYKSTPEGARDYLVPSRLHPGKVYALPQSPQTLKQLLMIGGTDRYFQITKCFRDEDLRADRQPEFTQIDIEAAFCTQETIKELATALIRRVYSLNDNFTLKTMNYNKALELYGTDKPDTRFDLLHRDVTEIFKDSKLSIFSKVCQEGGLIKCIFIPQSTGDLSRKQLDGLSDVVKPVGGKGVAWFKLTHGAIQGGISKFITEENLSALGEKEDGPLLFFADKNHATAHACADAVRRHLGETLGLTASGYHFLWVDDFPLLEYSQEEQRWTACHHPFTRPRTEDLEQFSQNKNLEQVRAEAYDLVLNGHEIAGGSLRIYDSNQQKRMFEILGLSEEEAQRQFGFFIEALQYGTPPHGGIAFGLDRMIMLLAGAESIRDVIAFPKTTSASDLMSGCPSEPPEGH